jgi:hypothetical protein
VEWLQPLGGVSGRRGEYGAVTDRKLALILALQKNRGELDADALKRLLASVRA